MFEFGKTLKATRNKRFLTIEEVSSITKIKEHYIAALEDEDFTVLPARVYTVGFIKNLADLYDLPASDLILVYDRAKNLFDQGKPKKDFTNFNKEVYEKSREINFDIDDSIDTLTEEKDLFSNSKSFEETFSKIKKLSLDDGESIDGTNLIIDEYIENSKDELKAISLINEVENKNTVREKDTELTSPTSKVMLEFEELMREEERFNTQKLRKMEAERNLNKTKNRVAQNKGFGMNYEAKNGAGMMILILLIVAILVLSYIIIKALITR